MCQAQKPRLGPPASGGGLPRVKFAVLPAYALNENYIGAPRTHTTRPPAQPEAFCSAMCWHSHLPRAPAFSQADNTRRFERIQPRVMQRVRCKHPLRGLKAGLLVC